MLKAIGVDDVEGLLGTIPQEVRSGEPLDIEGPLAEADLLSHLDSMKSREPRVDFTGAGLYQHVIPKTLDSLCARSEWVTSYTPYQAEISQGTLTMYYEFQTYMAMLSGQEIANAGMYDGSTALVEAVLMAMRLRPKADPVVYVSQAVHPEYVAVLRTYLNFLDVEVVLLGIDPDSGRTLMTVGREEQSSAIAFVVQSPNFLGVVEGTDELEADAFRIGVTTEALSMALLPPLDVDIMVGECQSFGIPVQLGGPTAGFFANSKKHVRRMPGRLVGRTVDSDGEEAFCITLATREQFIRREKATSNICTSSGLMCLRATVYLSLMGRKGLEILAKKNAAAARYFAAGFQDIGAQVAFSGEFFNEFVLDCSGVPNLWEALEEKGIVLGVPLGSHIEGMDHHYIVNVTEIHYSDAQHILEEIRNVAREL